MSEEDYPTVCYTCRRLYSEHTFIETLTCLKNANFKLREHATMAQMRKEVIEAL